jgi:hypothetical protein
VKVLKHIFSELGAPLELVTDRGPHYKAREFEEFCQEWGIRHTKSSPTYAQSNGQVERAIKTVKNIMRKSIETDQDPELALLAWRCTPLDSRTQSPAEMMFGRKVLVNLPVKTSPITEDVLNHRRKEQEKNTARYNQQSRPLPVLKEGSQVTFQDAGHWRQGHITRSCSEPRSYEIQTHNNTHVVRNRRHIRPTNTNVVRDGLKRSINNTYEEVEAMDDQETSITTGVDSTIQNNPPYTTRAVRHVYVPNRYQ